MNSGNTVQFLHWALPKLGLAWPGFRRLHHQVGKRIVRRVAELHLPDVGAYRAYLKEHPTEWAVLDAFCRIPISRFYRDKPVFDYLGSDVLPLLARNSRERRECHLKCCSIGCASGEEPYTLNLLWQLRVGLSFRGMTLHIIAVDIDDALLQRAQLGLYAYSA